MNEFFNNATTVTVGEGFTAFECVKAKFMKDYSASYRDGNLQLTKKWLKGDIIHGYLIQDKLNKYVETGVNNLCPKSGEAKIDVPANNETIVSIIKETPAVSGGQCVKLTFKKDYEAKFTSSSTNGIPTEYKGNWLKGDLINGRIEKSNGQFTVTTSTLGECQMAAGASQIIIAETDAEMKALFGEISDDMIQTMEVRKGQPLRDVHEVGTNGSGITTIKLNKKGAYLLAGLFVLIGLMLISKK